ncbi:DMT family transporter [Streptomyces microflavus]|uniref:hypothetical protein n=1 Tax=Streptomyces microflavus TaxID=1919 RepID=UPI0036988F6A
MKTPNTEGPARTQAFIGAGLVLVSCLSVQASAALASTLFDRLGAPAVAGLRQLCAALVLMALVRPRIRGHTRQDWVGMVIYGAAMAAMNVAYYRATYCLCTTEPWPTSSEDGHLNRSATARCWRDA